MIDATGRWVVDEGETLWWEFGAGEAMEPEEALRNSADNQQFVPAYDALVAIVDADAPGGTEVAVSRVDSLPTRDQVRALVERMTSPVLHYPLRDRTIDAWTAEWMALFGQTEGANDE